MAFIVWGITFCDTPKITIHAALSSFTCTLKQRETLTCPHCPQYEPFYLRISELYASLSYCCTFVLPCKSTHFIRNHQSTCKILNQILYNFHSKSVFITGDEAPVLPNIFLYHSTSARCEVC